MRDERGPLLDAPGMLASLGAHDVAYVLIGALAATLHGSPIRTGDADICPQRQHDNLVRLASALRALDARIWTSTAPEGLPFDRSAEMLASADIWNLLTRCGRLDVTFQPSGTGGYEDLVRDAVPMEVGGVTVLVASLADVIRSKEAAGRDKDRMVLPTLRKLLDHIEREDQK